MTARRRAATVAVASTGEEAPCHAHRDHVRVLQVSHNVNMLDQYLARDFGFYAEQGLEAEP